MLLGTASLTAGLIAGRADVVVIGFPLILMAAAAHHSSRHPAVKVSTDDAAAVRDGQFYAVPLNIDAQGGVVAIAVTGSGSKPYSYLLDASERSVPLTIELPLSGQRDIYALSWTGISVDATMIQQDEVLAPVPYTVLPAIDRLAALPLPPRLSGLTGDHSSRKYGDGGDLRDVHPFRPGDQLRRIDWRATARLSPEQRDLYVRRTHATSEAAVMLAVDTQSDLSSEAATWYGGQLPSPLTFSSLHLARHAATLVAASYLHGGDRVGVTELTGYRRGLRAAGGRRQLELIRLRLTSMRASNQLDKPQQDPVLPPDCLVMVFSPFMNDDGERLLLKWHRSGHAVIGVDTLPQLNTTGLSGSEGLALRMELMSRKDRIERAAQSGIPVFGWRGPDDESADDERGAIRGQLPLPAGLHMLNRTAARPRRTAAVRSTR